MSDKKDTAYQYIKQKIIQGEFKPMASISEDSLAKELGVSRMPIHQALLQLGNEGFVYVYPRKGTVVADITLDTVRWVYEMRRLLEPSLTAAACERIDREWLYRMKNNFQQIRDKLALGPSTQALEAAMTYDNELHSMISSCTDNRLLRNTMGQLFDYNQWIRIRVSRANQQYPTSIEAHIKIIDALIAADAPRAEKEMLEHLIVSEKEALHYR